jgi:hypothetical protein
VATGDTLQQNPDLVPANWTTVTNTPDLLVVGFRPPAAIYFWK